MDDRLKSGKPISRRTFLRAASMGAGALVLAACGGGAATAPTAAPAAATAVPPKVVPTLASIVQPTAAPAAQPTAAPTAAPQPATSGILNGVTLPADAAAPEHQVWVQYFDVTADFTTVDFFESVYKRGGALADLQSDPLVRLDKDFQVQPGAATKWSANDTGTVWTFNLDPNLVWSDGTPVTADDYVTTFRHAADPKHAWDFAWYFSAPGAIKNWDDVVAGKKPLDQLGVRADGPNTFIVETETPAPFLPAKLVYSDTMQKAAFEKHGPLYNSNPETSVSSGPYILKEWKKGEKLVWEANPTYKGNIKARIQKLINIGTKPETNFAGYQAGEVDYIGGPNLTTADVEIINSDPELVTQLRSNAQDFRTDYLFFDVKTPPFDNIKVRQAFGHIIDRDTLISKIISPSQGVPAYSFLMPGFPGSNSEGLKDLQSYDPAKAKALLTEAGFPDGKGFPKLTLWLRNEAPVRQAVAQAVAATIKQELGIEVEVANKDFKTFMESLNAKPTKVQFGMVSYGMDFLDPSNMLGVWLATGRHNWQNATYDKLVNDAAATVDNTTRIKMFQDAEKLLVTEAPGVYIYHRTVADLIKPYVKGEELEANSAGSSAIQWPGFSTYSKVPGSIYIDKTVTEFRKEPPK